MLWRSAINGLYNYQAYADPNAPVTYWATVWFWAGVWGSTEIMVNWVNNGGLYYRSLRDCCQNWSSWKLALDTENVSSYAVDLATNQTITGVKYFQSNKWAGSYLWANNTYGLEAYSSDGWAAAMSFHRGWAYAVNMGLDPDNVFRIGGWSAWANRWSLDTSGNMSNAGLIRAGTNIYTDANFGYGLVWLYDSTKYQWVFAMGDSYKLPANGLSPGNLYGIAWTHENASGQSKAWLEHQALFMMNGVTQTAIGNGIWTKGGLTFGSANPTISASSYFIAPGGAYFNGGTVYTEATIQARGWIHDDSHSYLALRWGISGDTEVTGQIKITGGSPWPNKVLTSDASGLASWQGSSAWNTQYNFYSGEFCFWGWANLQFNNMSGCEDINQYFDHDRAVWPYNSASNTPFDRPWLHFLNEYGTPVAVTIRIDSAHADWMPVGTKYTFWPGLARNFGTEYIVFNANGNYVYMTVYLGWDNQVHIRMRWDDGSPGSGDFRGKYTIFYTSGMEAHY